MVPRSIEKRPFKSEHTFPPLLLLSHTLSERKERRGGEKERERGGEAVSFSLPLSRLLGCAAQEMSSVCLTETRPASIAADSHTQANTTSTFIDGKH